MYGKIYHIGLDNTFVTRTKTETGGREVRFRSPAGYIPDIGDTIEFEIEHVGCVSHMFEGREITVIKPEKQPQEFKY